jgi:hypothetical protein
MADGTREAPAHNDESQQHWFAGKSADVLIYRINRRSSTLFQPPTDILAHLEAILVASGVVETGRRFKRLWRAGNKTFDYQAGIMTGIIGWARSGAALSNIWDEETQSWIDRIVPSDVSAAAPFAFIADGRYLGVLRHSSFREGTIAKVFTDLLNQGERRAQPMLTTEWDVEPVGDEQGFYEWVATTDRLLSVDFVFKRPNPDAEEEFIDLFRRLDEHWAKYIKETIAARDNDRGLNKNALREDHTSRSFITAAMAAFGHVVSRGIISNKQVKYDQRKRVAREQIASVSPTWEDATSEVVDAVRRARERRQHG